MVQQLNGKEVKQKIVKYLEEKGPCLPVQIAKYLSMNSLFASAFLSEMAAEKTIIISHMKVGGSPLYYLPSTYSKLESHINSLGNKEKEACLLLKEKGILQDEQQTPAIRIALRSLKDFAFSFKQDEKILWRYFLVSEEEVRKRLEGEPKVEEKIIEEQKKDSQEEKQEKEIEKKAERIIEQEEKKIEDLEKINKQLDEKRKELEILNKELENKAKEISNKQIADIKKNTKKQEPKKQEIDETFLKEIKSTLEKKKIEIISIESFDKKQVTATIKREEKELLLVAFNKKKIEEDDILRVSKQSTLKNTHYVIMLRGDLSKKTKEVVEAFKKLDSVEKIE